MASMNFGASMVTLGMLIMFFAPGWYGGIGLPFCGLGWWVVWREEKKHSLKVVACDGSQELAERRDREAEEFDYLHQRRKYASSQHQLEAKQF